MYRNRIKSTYSPLSNPAFIQRKMAHYNAWLIDPQRDPRSKYPGFPEELEYHSSTALYKQDFAARKNKKKAPTNSNF